MRKGVYPSCSEGKAVVHDPGVDSVEKSTTVVQNLIFPPFDC